MASKRNGLTDGMSKVLGAVEVGEKFSFATLKGKLGKVGTASVTALVNDGYLSAEDVESICACCGKKSKAKVYTRLK